MQLDVQLFHLLNNLAGQSRFLDGTFVFLAEYLPYVLIVVLLALVFFSQYPNRKKLEILLVAGVSGVIARFGVTELIRFFYPRPRPFITLPEIHRLLTENSWSFPSGHATFFFALSTAVYLYNKKWGVFFFAATILMTISRVIAGVHYPSDVLGGAIIGILVAYVTYWLATRIVSKSEQF
jgi:undecaprenyl-diphosphatase